MARTQSDQAQQERQDLVWMTEAQLEYNRSRGWFTARIKRGELRTYPQAGTSKIFLRRSEIEAALRQRAG